MVSICILWLILLRGVIWFMPRLIIMFEDAILLSMAFEYISWPIMFLSIMFDDMSWPIMFLSITFDDMSWPIIIDGISLVFMFVVILPWPIMLVYIVWSIMFISMLRLIMSVDRPRPIMLDVMLWPIILVDISRPSILEGMFRPIIFEGIPWVITSEDLCIEGIWLFLALMLDKVMSCPIMLGDMSRPILFGIPWFIMSDVLYKEDIWLFLDLMLDEVISRPIMLFGILCMSFPSSMRELESMYEVILVWIRVGSTLGSASASRLIYLPVLSAVSLRMWKPWLSAI